MFSFSDSSSFLSAFLPPSTLSASLSQYLEVFVPWISVFYRCFYDYKYLWLISEISYMCLGVRDPN